MSAELLRSLIIEVVQKENDTDLLDLVYKLLIAEGSHNALDAGAVLCG